MVPLLSYLGYGIGLLGLGGAILAWRSHGPGPDAVPDLLHDPHAFALALIESSQDPIYVVDPSGRITYLNPVFERLSGWDRAEWLGKSFQEICHPEDAPRVLARLERLVDGMILGPYRMRVRRKSGGYWTGEFRTVPLRQGAQVVGGVGIAYDLTGNLQLEQALRESERFLTNIFESIQDGISILDGDLRILRVNPTMERWYAHVLPLVGKKCYEVYHQRQQPCENCPSLRTLKSRAADYTVVPKTGVGGVKVGDLDLYAFPLVDSATGELKGVIEYVRDITERVAAENAARHAEALFRNLVEQSLVGIFILQDSKIHYANPKLAEIFGTTQAALYALPSFFDLLPSEDAGEMAQNLRRRLSETRPMVRDRFRGRRADGVLLELEMVGGEMDFQGQPALFGVVMDITESKYLEEQLRAAQRLEAVGRLAGGVAHDFNNILMAIQGYSELGLGHAGEGSPLRRDLTEIVKAAQRGASLTRQLLAYSRRQMLQPIVLDLNAVVLSLQPMLSHLIGEDIELVLQLAETPERIKADPGNLEQVVMNLTVNARDAMPEGGRLTIRSEGVTLGSEALGHGSEARPGQFVCLSVSDTGIGMDAETVRRAFEPFFSTKEIGKGTGLGLAVVHGIVKQHEGWIEVSSQLEHGTTFRVFLPAFLSQAPVLNAAVPSAPVRAGRGERILLIEDEDQVREFAARALTEAGYQVHPAATAQTAEDVFRRLGGAVDLLFCDVVLPDKSGLRLAEELRQQCPDLRVLLTSGYADHKSQWPLIRSRGLSFLMKPYTLQDLLQTVQHLLDAPARPEAQ